MADYLPNCTDADGRTLMNDMASSSVLGVLGAEFDLDEPNVSAVKVRVLSVW